MAASAATLGASNVDFAEEQLEPAPGYHQALEFLLGRVNFEKTGHKPYSANHYKLGRMQSLLESLGNPQLRLPTIHIAGTKGKGSTATYLFEILRAAGYRVGLFTSPHFLKLEERFTVDGEFCPPELLVQLVDRLRVAEERLVQETGENATFFELSTALAWLYFEAARVDAVVLEVGLGGRLDSTNVCSPLITIITSISLDHQAQLGNTISLIAGEKAGIIKDGIPVICGARHPDAVEVIVAKANACQAPLRRIGVDFEAVWQGPRQIADTPTSAVPRLCGEVAYSEKSPSYQFPNVTLGMPGHHQCDNAAIAISAGRWLAEKGWKIDESHLRLGLRAANARGRFELVGVQPYRIIDTAHNEASILSLSKAMEEYFPRVRRVVIFAASRDKDLRVMLRELVVSANVLVLTQYRENPRAVPIAQLQEIVAELATSEGPVFAKKMRAHTIIAKDPAEAYEMGLQLCGPDDLLCATGSFFLAAELFPIISLRRFERLTENNRNTEGEP
ncbi:MAG: bifunctional folylpolyglutamate synthase/dihydrofolate synthase [Planctomycetes bacterium]|nr:bifunctional folylpolyglutamate synthase/dihydrofolate synthase [Planctomycetota bacterium]